MTWLHDYIWPAEARWVHEEFVADGSRLAIAEMIRSGTTCFNDMYFFPDETAHAVANSGMRATIGMILIDFPTVWASDANEYLQKGLELHDYYRNNPLIKTAFAPHAPYTVSNEPLERVQVLADEMDVPIHMHVQETEDEIGHSMTEHNERPLQRLARLNLLSPRLMAVHMTHVEEDEIATFADSGAHVLHCPESNMKLASGICPAAALLEAGINVALGTDGTASNNDLDMFGEMRSAALLAKVSTRNACALPAATVLGMATINGARALGLDREVGSLVAGKAADMTAVNLGHLETQPVYNPISHLVYSASRHQVSDVWVAGKQLVKDHALVSLDVDSIISKAAHWQRKIAATDQ
jgi:5-methylthioadenosine/S-adenosylhomocysteine deaminase